jgi:hypothetical protein
MFKTDTSERSLESLIFGALTGTSAGASTGEHGTGIREFNELFPDVDWNDADKVMQEIAKIPVRVAADQDTIRHSDKQNARIEHDRALDRVMLALMADFTELFKQYSDNPAFKR